MTLDAFEQMVAAHVRQPRSAARQILGLMTGLEEQWLWAEQDFNLVAEWDRAIAMLLPRA